MLQLLPTSYPAPSHSTGTVSPAPGQGCCVGGSTLNPAWSWGQSPRAKSRKGCKLLQLPPSCRAGVAGGEGEGPALSEEAKGLPCGGVPRGTGSVPQQCGNNRVIVSVLPGT